MPHISPSSSEELTYNTMLQVKVDYFCHSWCQEEATRTQRLLWYRGDLLARYGYGTGVRTRCENLLWRLQYMLLPERTIKEHANGNCAATKAARCMVSHVWRNRFEKYNSPLIGPVYLTGRRWGPQHRPQTIGQSSAMPLKRTGSFNAKINHADSSMRSLTGQPNGSYRSTPSMPRVLSDSALSSCINPANIHGAMSIVHSKNAIASSLNSDNAELDSIKASIISNNNNSSNMPIMKGSLKSIPSQTSIASNAFAAQIANSNYLGTVPTADNMVPGQMNLPIKSALKRSYGSFIQMHSSAYQPHLCALDHLDLAGQLTPNRLRNLNESPWDAISLPINTIPSTGDGHESCDGSCDGNGTNECDSSENSYMTVAPVRSLSHGQASAASIDSLCSNVSGNSSSPCQCKHRDSAPSTPPKPRLTFKDTVERRIYVSDCEYSMHLEPLDNALYIRRKSFRRRSRSNNKGAIGHDDNADHHKDHVLDEEDERIYDHDQKAGIIATNDDNKHLSHSTVNIIQSKEGMNLWESSNNSKDNLIDHSSDALSHLRPSNHLDDEHDISSLSIGWSFEDDDDEEDEEEDDEEEDDEEDDDDTLVEAESNQNTLSQLRSRRRHRRCRRGPTAGQRAAAVAGNIIELINEACDLIHWMASVWLTGYYI
ncbi:hypothetical protein BDF19DRAFT_416915 [Syncephalis fuscata]|nr:hypothetical protein BDF19DRAFT_416915 [Syncephalis fuscata]